LLPADAAQPKAFVSRSLNAILFTARICPRCRRRAYASSGLSRAARPSAPARSPPTRADGASSSHRCRRSPATGRAGCDGVTGGRRPGADGTEVPPGRAGELGSRP
jgi:hypothetical protein